MLNVSDHDDNYILMIYYYMEVLDMANIKSAKKRILIIETKTQRNKSIKSKVKTVIKKLEAAIESGDKAAAQEALKVATSEISKATSKGVYHKKNASRKISRLSVAVGKMA